MIVFDFAPAEAPAPVVQCRSDVCRRLVEGSGDPGAPYMILTATGGRYRVLGQDSINPREWRSGERLVICPEPDTPGVAATFARVSDIPRGEDLLTIDLNAPRPPSAPAKEEP
jgi:hypothetical protein